MPGGIIFGTMKQTVELFCGFKSFSTEALARNYSTFTLDINKRFKPDLIMNIFDATPDDFPKGPHILWASPDCTWFSCASAHKHWYRDNEPRTLYAEQAIKMIEHMLSLIGEINPTYWFIENPTGKLRKIGIMDHLTRHQVTYCQYGEDRRKPTDIWTNNMQWKPRKICELTDPCHPGSTNALNTPSKRALIPHQLINEILDCC